jgi:membrane associated rhomboid family serine protease
MRLTNINNPNPFHWNHLKDAILVTLLLLTLIWVAFLFEEFMHVPLKRFGLQPRSLEGLWGIIGMFFLHGSWEHILHNSMGFAVLNTLLFYIYRKISIPVFLFIFVCTPILVWFFARPSNHIGASGVIYGLFGFLLFGGLLTEHPILRRVTLVVVLYYGSLIWWIFPIKSEISWEGHLSGFIVGILCAAFYRNQFPKRPKFQFEMEPELPDDPDAYWLLPEQRKKENTLPKESVTTVTIKYHYKESGNSEGKDPI